jgi:hypothetical protein
LIRAGAAESSRKIEDRGQKAEFNDDFRDFGRYAAVLLLVAVIHLSS